YLTQQGYPIARGERVRLTSNYDNTRPHTRVMGISVIYVAPQTVGRCAAPPTDGQHLQPAQLAGIPFRTNAPKFVVPLTGVTNGVAHSIKRPPGRTVRLTSGSTINAFDYAFSKPNVAVKAGSLVNWSFGPSTIHNVTLANGPRGFASPNLNAGRKFRYRFKVP